MTNDKKSNGAGNSFDKAAKSSSEVDHFAACKWRFIDALLRDQRLKPRDKVVGVRMVQRHIHHSDSIAYPGKNRLADDLGMKPRTVGRALAWLVLCGWFVQGRATGGKGLANEYVVDWSKYGKSKTLSDLAPFRNGGAETMTNEAVKGANGGAKRVSNLAPQKRKTKRDKKEGKGAAPSLASEPSGSASGKKRAQQGRSALPIPRLGSKHDAQGPTPAEEKIEQHLSTKCGLGPVQAWGLLIDVPEVALDCIAPRLGSLSKSELLAELKAATLPC